MQRGAMSGRYRKVPGTTAGPSRPSFAETTGAEGQQIQYIRGEGGSLIKVVLHQPIKRKLVPVPQAQLVQQFFEHQEGNPETDVKPEEHALEQSLPHSATNDRRHNRLGLNEENPFLPVPIDEEMNLVSTEIVDEAEHDLDGPREELNLTESNVDEEDPESVSIGLCESDEETCFRTGTDLTSELSESDIATTSVSTIVADKSSPAKLGEIQERSTITIVSEKSLSDKSDDKEDMDEACIVCNGELNKLNDPRKLNSVNLKVKHYFCQMMGIADAEGMQMSFDEEDAFPFCDSCSAEVTNMISVGSKIESLQKQYDSLRDSLAIRTVKTFFARTRPEVLQSNPACESEDEEVQAISDQTTPWGRVAKEWKQVYDVNSPGHAIPKPIPTKPQESRSLFVNKFRVSKETANSTFPMDVSDSFATAETQELASSTSRITTLLKTQIKIEPGQELQPRLVTDVKPVLPGREYQCTECPKTFPSSGLLAYHNRIHTGELPFECETCGKGFAVPHYLVIHMRTHTGERPFTCDICHKGFAQRGGLITHSLVHTGAKPFECDICQKRFRQRYHLTQHLLIHSGSKPFGCDICGKFFNVKMNLREHKRRHTGDRPYKCPHCVSIGFFRKRMLRDHIVKTHPGKELPPELANLGATRIPPSLTKEGRKAYKNSNAARRNRNKLKKTLNLEEELLPLQVNLMEDEPLSQSPSKDMSDGLCQDSDNTQELQLTSSIEEGASVHPDGSETNDLIIDTNTDNNATTILC